MGKIKINQVGYLPTAKKIGIVQDAKVGSEFRITDYTNGHVVYRGVLTQNIADENSGHKVVRADFTPLGEPGKYCLEVPGLGVSYPFTIAADVYKDVLRDSLRSYCFQRSNTKIVDPVLGFKVEPSHGQDSEARLYFSDPFYDEGDKLNVEGGWYDAGDYGKYIPPAAITLGQLLLAYELRPGAFYPGQLTFPFRITDKELGLPDILVECKFELEWMLKMQRPDGAVYHKVAGKNWPTIKTRPEDDTQARYVYGLSTYGTAQFAGAMALAARVYKPLLPCFANKLLEAAKLAQDYLNQNPQPHFRFDPGQNNGSGPYGKETDTEERIWALAELFKTTGNNLYNEILLTDFKEHLVSLPDFISWGYSLPLGQWAYFTATGKSEVVSKEIVNKYELLAQVYLECIALDGYLNILKGNEYTWASAKNVAAKGNMLLFANYMNPNGKYVEGALEQVHNILGRSATGYSYLTGIGTKTPENVHHRLLQSLNVEVPGYLVGGPNRYGGDPDLDNLLKVNKPKPALAYLDQVGSWSSNEYAIDYNAPVVLLLAHFV